MAKWRIALWAAIVVAALTFIWAVRGILLPFILAWVIAILLEPVVKKLRRLGMPRVMAVLSIAIGFFALLGAIGVLMTPKVTAQLGEVRVVVENITNQLARENQSDNFFVRWNPRVQAAPTGALGAVDRFLGTLSPTLERFDLPNTRQEIVEQYVQPHQQEIATAVQNFFNSFLGIIAGAASQVVLLLFTPLIAIFIMLEMDRIHGTTPSYIPPLIRKDTLAILKEIGDVFAGYLRGLSLSLAVYVTCMCLLLAVLEAPYAILLGILAGVFYVIPVIGGWLTIGSIFGVTYLSGQTGNWMYTAPTPLLFTLSVVIPVILFGDVIYSQVVVPHLVGKSVGLNPALSIFVVFAGGALFGVLGMILAYPIAGAAKVTVEKLIRLTTTPTPDLVRLPSVPMRHRTDAL